VTAICIPYFFWKRKVNGVKPYEDPEKWKKRHSLSRGMNTEKHEMKNPAFDSEKGMGGFFFPFLL
jgi:hypothetical protein